MKWKIILNSENNNSGKGEIHRPNKQRKQNKNISLSPGGQVTMILFSELFRKAVYHAVVSDERLIWKKEKSIGIQGIRNVGAP